MAQASPPSLQGKASSAITLSPDLWARIARAALAAGGESVEAWCRLSLVSHTFRTAILGENKHAGACLLVAYAGS